MEAVRVKIVQFSNRVPLVSNSDLSPTHPTSFTNASLDDMDEMSMDEDPQNQKTITKKQSPNSSLSGTERKFVTTKMLSKL